MYTFIYACMQVPVNFDCNISVEPTVYVNSENSGVEYN